MNLQSYLEDLEYLVNIDSGTENAKGVNKVADYFVQKFKDMNWDVKEIETKEDFGKCVICTNREADHHDLLMIGHTDTVFPNGTCANRPFTIDGNRAYGPGVCDMKHGCLMMYYLIKNQSKEIIDKLNIVVIFNPDEEIGSIYSKDIYGEYARKSDYAFVYEASLENTGCCAERKGNIVYQIEFFGKSGHCAYIQTNGARSATHEMGKWIVKFDSMMNLEHGTTVNVGIANGGIKKNIVAPEAIIIVDVRFSDPNEEKLFDKMVEEMTADAKTRGIKVNISSHRKKALKPTSTTIDYLKHVEQIAKQKGIEFKYAPRGGVSDANIIATHGTICLDGLAPTGGLAHCPEEFMLIDSIIPYYNLSKTLIEDLANNKISQKGQKHELP